MTEIWERRRIPCQQNTFKIIQIRPAFLDWVRDNMSVRLYDVCDKHNMNTKTLSTLKHNKEQRKFAECHHILLFLWTPWSRHWQGMKSQQLRQYPSTALLTITMIAEPVHQQSMARDPSRIAWSYKSTESDFRGYDERPDTGTALSAVMTITLIEAAPVLCQRRQKRIRKTRIMVS